MYSEDNHDSIPLLPMCIDPLALRLLKMMNVSECADSLALYVSRQRCYIYIYFLNLVDVLLPKLSYCGGGCGPVSADSSALCDRFKPTVCNVPLLI